MDIILDPNILFLDQQSWENSPSRTLFLKQINDLLDFVGNAQFKILLNNEIYILLYSGELQPWKLNSGSLSNAIVSVINGLLLKSKKSYECPVEPEECMIAPDINCLVGLDTYYAFLKLIFNATINEDKFYFYLSQYNIHCIDGFIIECKCGSFRSDSIIIENISAWIQNDTFLEYLKASLSARGWRPSDTYFPNSIFTNKIEPNNKTLIEIAKRNPEQRNSLALTRGSMVAMINGYSYDKNLSYINSTKEKIREIYYAGEANNRIYLSIDVKSLAFEVCDYNGKHLGEFNFDGEQSKEIDTFGGHDIKIK